MMNISTQRTTALEPRDSNRAICSEEEEETEMQFAFDENWSTPPKHSYVHLMGKFKCKECGSDLVKLNAKQLCGKVRCVKGDISKIL